MSTRIACTYAIAQFLPYPETGEFANVGIVLSCPSFRYMGVKMASARRSRRITEFFEGLSRSVYSHSIKYVDEELKRIAVAVQHGAVRSDIAFQEVIRPRETLIRFSKPNAILIDGHPADAVSPLFKRFVERDFASREYDEQRLTSLIGSVLADASLKTYFREYPVGTSEFQVKFPFVHLNNGTPSIVIKPLHLAQKEPSKVRDHGLHWAARLQGLQRHHGMPSKLLFAVNAATQGNAASAAREVIGDLQSLGADVVDAADQARIVQFADDARLI